MPKQNWIQLPDGQVEHRSATVQRLAIARTQLEVLDTGETARAKVERLAIKALSIFEAGMAVDDATIQRQAARDVIFAYEKIKKNAPPEIIEVQEELSPAEKLARIKALIADPPPEIEAIMVEQGWKR